MLQLSRRDALRSVTAHAAVVTAVWLVALPVALQVGSAVLWVSLTAAATALGLVLHVLAYRRSTDVPVPVDRRRPAQAPRKRPSDPGVVIRIDDWSRRRRSSGSDGEVTVAQPHQ